MASVFTNQRQLPPPGDGGRQATTMAHPWETRWKLEERLGRGGQGVTHAASFVDNPTVRGALKYLKNNRDAQARGRMRREVANLQTLANAGGAVPRVLDHNTDCFEDRSVELYVVMDLIDGPTLAEHVRARGRLSIDESVQVALSLCKTVKVAHTFPILHRDLKPDNIVLRQPDNYDLCIVDYGLSFNASDEPITEADDTFRNQFLDLPETNTPSGDRRDPRSDLTAICAILYFCMTGNVPGQLQDGTGALPHMRQGFSLREKQHDERVPYLEEFLSRGFAPNIANRYQAVDEIVTRLGDFVRGAVTLDESDPFQLAASLSLQLRARDRITQLAEFREQAQALFQHIMNEAQKYQKLGRFQVSNLSGFGFGGGFNPNRVKIPDGLDLIEQGAVTVVLQAAHHPHQRHRLYVVGSRGEQCVLLAADYNADAQRPPQSAGTNHVWQEIAWYEGNPETIYNLVSVSYRDWLLAQMRQLTTEILSK